MFFSGDLASGISKAVHDGNAVVCFIRNEGDEIADLWETQWLASPIEATQSEKPLGDIISDKSVFFKIEHQTKEAEFLGAFCSVDEPPNIIVIRYGKVLAQLKNSITHEEFVGQLMAAVSSDHHVEDSMEPETTPDRSQLHTQNSPPVAEAASPQSNSINEMYTERAQRCEAERNEREAREKRARQERAQARKKEAEEASASHKAKGASSEADKRKQTARNDWIYQQNARKEEARQDQARVKARIEADKLERKVRAQQAKERQGNTGESGSASQSATEIKQSSVSSTKSGSCALLVRLFDGSSVKGKFASDTDLATAVRTWIQEIAPERSADPPYTFRQILTPQPSRSIELSEEHTSLRELGLAPTATLVLVPVSGGVEAYPENGGHGGYLSSAVNAAYWAAGAGISAAGSVLSFVPGLGHADNEQASTGPYIAGTGDSPEVPGINEHGATPSDPTNQEKTPGMRVKTLADQRAEQRAEQGTEFYNGNSSAFQGRKDE